VAESTQAERDVLPEFGEEISTALRLVVSLVEDQHRGADGREVAKLSQRGGPRLGRVHPGSHQRVDPRLEMEGDLVVHVSGEAGPAERNTEHTTHGVPSVLEGSIRCGFFDGKPQSPDPRSRCWRLAAARPYYRARRAFVVLTPENLMRRLVSVALLFAIVVRPSPGFTQTLPALKGSVDRIKVHGAALEGNLEGDSPDRDVSVYLPPSYKTDTQRRYPVVYVLHGFTDSENGWFRVASHFVNLPASMEKAMAAGKTREMILVTPNAYTRYAGSFYGSSPTTGDWETYVTRELVSYVDAHYRTIASRSSRGLAGHSMGGYGTFRLAMKYPEVYGAVYALSACCLVPTYAQPAGVAKAEAIHSDSDFAKADFITKVLTGLAAAWSPNPKTAPYFEFPYKSGTLQPEVMAEWSANAPTAMLSQYAANLKRIPFIAFDVGLQDGLLGENQRMDRLFADYSIQHTFETYEGTHTSKIAERLETSALPFFSKGTVVRPTRGRSGALAKASRAVRNELCRVEAHEAFHQRRHLDRGDRSRIARIARAAGRGLF